MYEEASSSPTNVLGPPCRAFATLKAQAAYQPSALSRGPFQITISLPRFRAIAAEPHQTAEIDQRVSRPVAGDTNEGVAMPFVNIRLVKEVIADDPGGKK